MSGAETVPEAVAELAAIRREYDERGELWTDEQMNGWGEREHAAVARLARAAPRSPHELAEKIAVLMADVLEGSAYAMSEPEILGLGNLVDEARRIAADFKPMPSREVH
jgi:hypothetical protein